MLDRFEDLATFVALHLLIGLWLGEIAFLVAG